MLIGPFGGYRRAVDRGGRIASARQLWPIPAVTLLALALGLWKLGHLSFDFDEGVSAYAASRPLSDVLYIHHGEPNNALYFDLLFLWQKLGSSDLFLRLLSVFAYVAAVPLTAAIAWRSFGRPAGIAAGLLLAVNAFAVEMAQNARAFALLLALVSASTLCFMIAVERSTRWRWGLWAILSALSVYAFPSALFVVAAQVISLAWLPAGRAPWRQAGIAAGALTLAVLPLLVVLATEPTRRIDWVPSPNYVVVATTLKSVIGTDGVGSPLVLIYGALAIVVTMVVISRRPRRSEESWRAVLPLLWLVVPLVLALAFSLVQPIFHDRYLTVILPALAIVAAGALTRLRPWPLVAAALGALCVLHLPGLRNWYGDVSKPDLRGATRVIDARAGTGEIVLVDPPAPETIAWYLDRDVIWQHATPGEVGTVEFLDPSERAELSETPQRLWLVEFQSGGGFNDDVRWLTAAHPVLAEWDFHDVRVLQLGP
jgi:mannosyltransferase